MGDEGESLTKRLILLSFGQYSIHLETESYWHYKTFVWTQFISAT